MAASRVGSSFKFASRRLISGFQSGIVELLDVTLFGSQCDHRVNLRRAPRRKVAGKQRNNGQ